MPVTGGTHLVAHGPQHRRPPAGKLLADWRRINVAITRARKKLVLVGDAATLASLPLFERLVGLVRQRGWYLQLPPDAVQAAAGAAPA